MLSPKVERAIYIGIIAILGITLIVFGKQELTLKSEIPASPDELYEALKKSNIQIIDVRPYKPADEDEEPDNDYMYYTQIHIPNSIPMPDCDINKAPEEAKEQINPYIPTYIVSENGDPKAYEKCKGKFIVVRNVIGGIRMWDEEKGYPTDEGEYEPPKAGGGGGCL